MGGPGFADGKTYQCFDNFHPCSFLLHGLEYKGSEQAYQALKFKDPEWREKIRTTWNPHQAWALGQSREHELVPNFEAIKEELMYQANWAKFSQSPELRRVLLSTRGDIAFTKSSPFWNAANGRILMKIREALRRRALQKLLQNKMKI